MYRWKSIVITVYGHDKSIDKITVSLFDEKKYGPWSTKIAEEYCDNINGLELNGEAWISAKIVTEDKQYKIEEFFPFKFDILLKMDSKSIQELLRLVDNKELLLALYRSNETVQEKIFSNMSKRAAQIIKEDMGTSKNPCWVFRGSLEKIVKSLLRNELHDCNFLLRVRKLLKTEVFRSSHMVNWNKLRGGKEAQKRILKLICHLEDTHEITIQY
ncbi:MAG: hypothetical protein LBI14_10945 [Treponema sp.]|jgi:hypothetical protein|nr:hypothetical protein [Treponema sp.]